MFSIPQGLNTKVFDDFTREMKMNGKVGKGLDVEMTQSVEPVQRRRYGEPKPLSHSEVCAILETCLKCGVSNFSYNGLVVSFGQSPVAHEAVLAGCPASSVAEEESQGRLDGLTALGERVDDELEMLKITNPLLYEKYAADEANK